MNRKRRRSELIMLRIICFQVCYLSLAFVFGQTPLSFYHLSRSDGLSNPFNSYVYQDSRGFVWISSVDGLNRFDGENIRVYRPDPTQPHALTGNIISSNFYEDPEGDLWFTSYGSLHVYRRVRDHFESFQLKDGEGTILTEDYHAFHMTEDGALWVRTGLGEKGTLHRFRTGSGEDEIICAIDGQRNYLISPPGERGRYILSTMVDEPGIEWVDLEDPRLTVQKWLEKTPGGDRALKTYNAYPVNSDTIFIGTDQGLAIFSYDRNSLEIFSEFRGRNLGMVWSVFPLDKNKILVSTEKLGILLFDLISRNFIFQYGHTPDDEFSLSSANIREIYVDQSKTLWASIWGKGLDYASFNKNNFPLADFDQFGATVEIREIFQEDKNRIWANLVADGLVRLDSSGQVVQQYQIPRLTGSGRPRLDHFLMGRDGRKWIFVSDENSDDKVLFSQAPSETGWKKIGALPDAIFSNLSAPMFQLSDDRIFVCTRRGVFEIKDQPDEVSIEPCEELAGYRDLPFYKIYEDHLGQVYFTANYDRILVYRLQQDSLVFQRSLTEVGDVKGFWQGTRDSVLWLATSSGLFEVNVHTLTYQLISGNRPGLTSESILAVLEDSEENLWLKTQDELWKYHPLTNEIRRYNLSNGIQENLSSQIPSLKTLNGEFWLGGPRGLTIFRPENIHDFPVQATVQITNILTNGEKLLSDTFVGELAELILPFSENTVSFEFVSCEYSDPGGIRFRYRMGDFDPNWVDGGSLGFARYANLPAGRYQFEVQVANADGIWSENSRLLMLQVLPPWYQTWWARSVFILTGFLLLFAFYRWRTHVHRRKLRLQEIELDRERKLNERLRQVDQLKDQFLANTSHELRTPLIGIIGLAESLKDGATGQLPEVTRQNLELITASGKRLSHLIDDVLDFSRMRNQDLELIKANTDLHAITELVCTLLRPSIAMKDLQLYNEIPTDLPLIMADENRLQQILFNLLGNAIKFTDSGRIVVSAALSEDEVEISISDTGIGIEEDKLESIFEGFEQVDGSSSRKYGGTGLGLTITRQLVELHGGQIRVKSRLGVGSVFSFTLPLDPASTELRETGPGDKQRTTEIEAVEINTLLPVIAQGNAAGNILVVDDELVNLQVLYNHLTLEGYSVVRVSSGQEAIDLIEGKNSFDLVILDIMMPRMSGFEVCYKIREKYSPSQLPVIMLTAKNQIADLVEGFDAGANDYLGKPFSKDELLSRLKTHLRLHRINRATGRFVPYEFLHSIGRDEITDVQLGDHSHFNEISVLFADIRSYTTLAERMSPEENFHFVNAFVGRMGPVIEKYHGIIEQYLGDAILAIFPRCPDDAVNAAVEMHQVILKYNQERLLDQWAPLQIGIGIHTGPLIMGIIGHESRVDTAIISDTVNIASRFEGLTKFYGANILLSDACFDRIADLDHFHFRYLGAVKVKGKNETNRVYECIDGDDADILEKKMSTQKLFDLALEYYVRGEFGEASACFQTVLRENNKDEVSRIFQKKSAQHLAKGTSGDWQGVDLMDTK